MAEVVSLGFVLIAYVFPNAKFQGNRLAERIERRDNAWFRGKEDLHFGRDCLSCAGRRRAAIVKVDTVYRYDVTAVAHTEQR